MKYLKPFFVYALLLPCGNIYCGMTNNLARRMYEHRDKRGTLLDARKVLVTERKEAYEHERLFAERIRKENPGVKVSLQYK